MIDTTVQTDYYSQLRPQHRKFVDAVVATIAKGVLNHAEAARKAGYSVKSARRQGHKLATRDNVKRAIEQKMRAFQAENEDDVRKTRERLREIAFGKDEVGNYKSSTNNALKALELIGKAEAMYTDKHILTPEVPVLSPEQIKLYRERAAILDGTHPALSNGLANRSPNGDNPALQAQEATITEATTPETTTKEAVSSLPGPSLAQAGDAMGAETDG